MINTNILVEKISQSGFTVDKLAGLLKINTVIFQEKLENRGSSFTIREKAKN